MANFVGAIENFNPYIQQIPTDAYVKVGMFKEQEYQAGIAKVQDNIDKIAGLDIATEGGRNYLRNRVDELTNTLNKYSMVDFANPNNVAQLTSLAKPLYQDENIVNDVINTSIYRKWAKDSADAYKNGKMELGQYMRETNDASAWLNSKVAGAQYTGRQTPNTATKKELTDRIIKAKKDGIDQNEYKYDINYSKDTPYYVKSTNKYYSEADFNNFVTETVMTEKDREMLMNGHWLENQGASTEALQKADLEMYQAKIDANTKQIDYLTDYAKTQASDDKLRTEQTITNLKTYNTQLANGKMKFLQGLNLNDPSSRDVFHRDLAESRYVDSLKVLLNESKGGELVKNEQWFAEFNAALDAIKKAAGTGTGTGKTKTPQEQIDEVAVYTPVDPSAPKTEVSLNVIQSGWQKRSDEIVSSMNGLIGKLQENGIDVNKYIAGWDQVQVGTKAGAAVNVPRFKSEADKQKFYSLVSGLNYAYTKEAEDGHLDNHSLTQWVKERFPQYKDDDPNSKFGFTDKIIQDALNEMKGTTALLPRLEKLFSDKGVVRALSQMDESLKSKKDMANVYREALLKSNALSADEMKFVRTASDEDLLTGNYQLNPELDEKRLGPGKRVRYRVGNAQGLDGNNGGQEADGTYSIYRDIYTTNEKGKGDFVDFGPVTESQKIVGGYTNYTDALYDIAGKNLNPKGMGISKESMKKADEFVRQTYSYVQENVNSTVQNLKEDKPAYAAISDGIGLFMAKSKLQATNDDISVENGTVDLKSLTGINKIEILGASISNTADVFDPNPVYHIQFSAFTNQGGKDQKEALYNATVSIKSFLATNPNYRTSEYAKYFAPMLYAEQDAQARIKATINPLEGSEASYANRPNITPVFNTTSNTGASVFQADASPYSQDIQWQTIPIEKDGKQTMVSYQITSLGQNTVLGNIKNKDGQTYAPGAFYIKMRVPTSSGESKEIFLKKPNGDSYVFSSAAHANYTIRDLIFNNPEIKMDEVDPTSGEINYLTVDPSTIRGIFNAQLSYNGYSKLDMIKLKDALGKEITKQQAKELQLAR